MNEEVGAVFQHGPVGAHAAAPGIDAPTLPGGIARPDERYRFFLRGRGPKVPDLGFSRNSAFTEVHKLHAIKNILSRRETFEQELRCEVAIRQRVCRCRGNDGPEAFDGRTFHLHAGRPVGPRPHHRGVAEYIARLHPAGDLRTIRGPAEIWPGETHRGERYRRGRPNQEFASAQTLLRMPGRG